MENGQQKLVLLCSWMIWIVRLWKTIKSWCTATHMLKMTGRMDKNSFLLATIFKRIFIVDVVVFDHYHFHIIIMVVATWIPEWITCCFSWHVVRLARLRALSSSSLPTSKKFRTLIWVGQKNFCTILGQAFCRESVFIYRGMDGGKVWATYFDSFYRKYGGGRVLALFWHFSWFL